MTEQIECRWGGRATAACWNIGACGCGATAVEDVWREAHAEQFERAWTALVDALAEGFRLPQIIAWLDRRLAR